MPHFLRLFRLGYQSDSFLSLGLYVVGALFVALGGYVSISPPRTKMLKGVSFVAFCVLFGVGFWIAREQAKRAAKTTLESAAALKQDGDQKARYEGEVLALRNQLIGIKSAVESVAKGSPNPAWQEMTKNFITLDSKIDAIPSGSAHQCVGDEISPYRCKSNSDLGQYLIDESEKIYTKAVDVQNEVRRLRDDTLPDKGAGFSRGAMYFYTEDMVNCCLRDIGNLRSEAIQRLGPIGKTKDEERGWENIQVTPSSPVSGPTIYPRSVEAYAPELKRLGDLLRAKQP